VPKYGGHHGEPDLGANGRRFILLYRREHGDVAADEVLRKATIATVQGNPAASRPVPDRFLSWKTIGREAGMSLGEAKRFVDRAAEVFTVADGLVTTSHDARLIALVLTEASSQSGGHR
jgi:hypothetical protein